MDFEKILADLREELQCLNAAIQTLEQLEARGIASRRRGRPPALSGVSRGVNAAAGPAVSGSSAPDLAPRKAREPRSGRM
jgi:hypothetical protein